MGDSYRAEKAKRKTASGFAERPPRQGAKARSEVRKEYFRKSYTGRRTVRATQGRFLDA